MNSAEYSNDPVRNDIACERIMVILIWLLLPSRNWVVAPRGLGCCFSERTGSFLAPTDRSNVCGVSEVGGSMFYTYVCSFYTVHLNVELQSVSHGRCHLSVECAACLLQSLSSWELGKSKDIIASLVARKK